MEDFSKGSGLNLSEYCQQIEGTSRCYSGDGNDVQNESEDCDENLRGLFDQVLMVLLRGAYGKNIFRPMPPVLGNGHSPALFKLFWLVRDRGGFDSVSQENLWGLIAEKMGMEFSLAASLKLIHFKYLNELDQWLDRISGERTLSNGSYDCSGNLGMLSLELEKRFREFSRDREDSAHKYDTKRNCIDLFPNERFQATGLEQGNTFCCATSIASDDDEKISKPEGCLGRYCLNVVKKDTHSRKRKHDDTLAGMLNWLAQAAQNPWDSSIAMAPHRCNSKENGSSELWLVLKAREAMLRASNADMNNDMPPSEQKKIRMHPSMYEDRQPAEGVRSSKRHAPVKDASCSCCKSCSTSTATAACPLKSLQNDASEAELVHVKTDSISVRATSSICLYDLPVEKRVPIGRHFQAEVSNWFEEVSDSDSKWLGTRVWPPDKQSQNSDSGMKSIGKGRLEFCDCAVPSSVECIRFHTAENKMRLMRDLGPVFHRWGFDRMGEEVSLSWSEGEEKRFKEVIRFNPISFGRSFFHKKTTRELVSYYFNVYLINRRRYQNRVTPSNVDSDDDETPFGSVGGVYGHQAVKASGSNLLTCPLNEQCLDLDGTAIPGLG